jgi:hypothetical protein
VLSYNSDPFVSFDYDNGFVDIVQKCGERGNGNHERIMKGFLFLILIA